jgi:hypothetical protein
MRRFLWYFILKQGSIIPDTNNHSTQIVLVINGNAVWQAVLTVQQVHELIFIIIA